MVMSYSPTTMTLRDALRYETDLLDNLVMSTSERTEKFINMFKAKYNNKSIGSETISLFRYWIEDKFSEIVDYYESKITIYETQLNGDSGIVSTRIITETNGSTVTNNSSNNIDVTSTDYDLPRSSSATASPTTQNVIDEDRSGNSSSTGTGNRDVTETNTGDVNVIEQREKWLGYIRNLYSEMCDEFKDCFAIIYS